jgi:hypothetical protein
MLKKVVRVLKALRCRVFICCKSKCSIGDNDEIVIENMKVENNINNNCNGEIIKSNEITSDI